LFKAVVAVYALIALATISAGVVYVHRVTSGIRAVATVDSCVSAPAIHGVAYYCTGSWVVHGSVLGSGHVVVGSIVGATPKDLHKAVHVRVSGGTAYVRSLTTGVVLILLGVAVCLLPVAGIVTRRVRARRGAAARPGYLGIH
jgi:hypothetical protein